MERKVSLPWNHRCYLDVRGLLRSESVTQSIEELTLGKAAGAGGNVWSQILGAGDEGSDAKLLSRVSHTIEEPWGTGVVAGHPMTPSTVVGQDQLPTKQNLILTPLCG
jgi:hypothetical protein